MACPGELVAYLGYKYCCTICLPSGFRTGSAEGEPFIHVASPEGGVASPTSLLPRRQRSMRAAVCVQDASLPCLRLHYRRSRTVRQKEPLALVQIP